MDQAALPAPQLPHLGRRRSPIPFLIALAFYLAKSDPHGGEGPLFFQQVTGNGMYVALAALSALLPFLLPMAAAMVAGYMIAGEAELGTLRIVLLRPVRRGSLLLSQVDHGHALSRRRLRAHARAAACSSAAIFFGLHPMVTLSGTHRGVWHGLGLIVLCCLYGLAAMACIVSLALLFSAITDSSLTALIATIVIYIVVQVLIAFSYFDWLRPWVFPNYFLEYVNFFRDPIYWTPILKGLAVVRAPGASG